MDEKTLDYILGLPSATNPDKVSEFIDAGHNFITRKRILGDICGCGAIINQGIIEIYMRGIPMPLPVDVYCHRGNESCKGYISKRALKGLEAGHLE
jgi:hypothetical protein